MTEQKTVLIMGLGLHGGGLGAANYFIECGHRVIITDLKKEQQLKESINKLKHKSKVRFTLGRHEFSDFKDADLVVKNPAVPRDSPYIKYAKENGVAIDTDVGIFLDNIKNTTKKIIGVTGTKGKSTVATLIHKIFSVRYPDAVLCGNITVSVFDVIEFIKKDTPLIIELSSFQLGGIREKKFSPQVAVFTNFFEDHLDYYSSMKDYFEDKSVLYMFQHPGDLLVYNRDDVLADMIKSNEGVSAFTFGMEEGSSGDLKTQADSKSSGDKTFSGGYKNSDDHTISDDNTLSGGQTNSSNHEYSGDHKFQCDGTFIREGKIYYKKDGKVEPVIDVEAIRLPGMHNLYNVMAAVTAAMAVGIPKYHIEQQVSAFKGLAHRLEHAGQKNGVSFYNDSAATNPRAAINGIKAFAEPVTLIAGGYDKGLSLREFIRIIDQKVKHLVLLEGSGTDRLIKEGVREPVYVFDSMNGAVRHAYEISRPSGTVLLAPGFASFGMFRNEFHRGDEFLRIVKQITKREGA